MAKNQGYKLIVGRMQEDWHTKELKYSGNTDYISPLTMPSIEAAHQIARLCNIKVYMIVKKNDTWGIEALFTSPEIIEYEHNQKEERKQHDIESAELVKKINVLPTTYLIKEGKYTLLPRTTINSFWNRIITCTSILLLPYWLFLRHLLLCRFMYLGCQC